MKLSFGTLVAAAAMVCMATTSALACTITGVSSITGLTGNLGTYTTASGATVTLTSIVVRVTKINNGSCPTLGLAFAGTAVTPTMTGPGSLTYTIQSTGGTNVYFTSSPSGTISLTPPGPSLTNGQSAFNYNAVSVVVTAPTGQVVPSGAYGDMSIVARVFNGGIAIGGVQPALNVSATVVASRTCTIGGSGSPTRGSAVIPVAGNGRITNLAPITPTLPLGNAVVCTGAGAVVIDLLSQNGRLTGPANANPAFANTINYTASASVAGGTAATFNSSSGVAVQGTTGGTSGNLTVSITPVDPGIPLIAGAYSDVLTVRITPQ